MRTNYTSNGHICFKRTGLHAFSRRKLRLVIVGDSDAARRDELVIVLNWFDELERLLPTED